MLGFLKNPHAFAIALAVLTAFLAHMYAKTTESDPQASKKVFWKTLVMGVISGLLLTWLVHRPEPITTEPFAAEA
jgi:L-cystine uptake protein TcyP (sodium:dicarboxylate symporter family)